MADKKINYPANRKPASDSLTSVKEVVALASEVIQVPEHITLNSVAEVYFREVINQRANADWPAHDVSMAAKLARMMAHEDELDAQLQDEGPTVTGVQGGEVKNPTATVLANLRASIATFRRQLCLHAQSAGRSADIGSRRGQRRAVQDAATSQAADPLLAG